jgi:methionine synthase II (cobalamin-independent)
MPLFDWDVSSVNDAAGSHFWVFWALTGPLTAVTIMSVVTWAVWRSRSTRNTERKAREDFSQAIADEAQQLKRAATMRTMGVTETN